MTTETRRRKYPRAYLYKACPRCHGDLILDRDLTGNEGRIGYVCLQCGRGFAADMRHTEHTSPAEKERPAA